MIYCKLCNKNQVEVEQTYCSECMRILLKPVEKKEITISCRSCGTKFSAFYPHHAKAYCSKCKIIAHNTRRVKDSSFDKEDFLFIPTNEQEVVVLFFKVFKQFGFKKIKKIQLRFPDAIVTNNNNEIKTIEFEYLSSGFIHHMPQVVDYIVCWFKDKTFPELANTSIIELKSFFSV